MSRLPVCLAALLGAVLAPVPAAALPPDPLAADFNGDGFEDLAVGVPFEDVGEVFDAGVVHVVYGAAGGLTADGSQLWHGDVAGVPRDADTRDLFGSSVAAGDFDGDGFADLAIGAIGEDAAGDEFTFPGAVTVLYGSAGGLTTADAQVWDQDSDGVPGATESSDQFAATLATGDFDGDGFADLVAGVPAEDVFLTRAGGERAGVGVAEVFYGSADGLTSERVEMWHQARPGIVGAAQTGDLFGSALAAGDLDGDGDSDLAVGVPHEDVFVPATGGHRWQAGAVNVIYGSEEGLTAAGNQVWHQDTPGVLEDAQRDDHFGSSLAAGDFDDDGAADLAIGIPLEGLAGIADHIGAVSVLYGGDAGLTADGDQFWSQAVEGVPGSAETGDIFGDSLAARDHDGDGSADLAIGVPFESIADELFDESEGAVNVVYGGETGLSATAAQLWHEDVDDVADSAQVGDRFGDALTALDADGDGGAEMVVGAPGEDVSGLEDAGQIHVFPGGDGGLTAAGDAVWNQDTAGIADQAESEVFPNETVNFDRFGLVLSDGTPAE